MIQVKLTRGRRKLLGALVLGTALGAAALAVVYANAERLDIADRKSSVFRTVTTVDRSTQMNVVGKEGRWYKVEVGGKQGYVSETAVSQTPVKKGQKASLAKVNGAAVPELETAAAVKGLNDNAAKYASNAGLRTEGLLELQRRRDAISPDEFEQFKRQAGVAEAEAAETDAVAASTK